MRGWFRGRVIAGLSVLALVISGFAAPRSEALSPNEPALEQQWGMRIIGAPRAWQAGATGAGQVIAIVDSGVDFEHEDLAAPGKILPGRSYVDDGPPQDEHGHGTHVSGIAAAVTGNGIGVTGVAPDAKILPVRVFDSSGATTGNIGEAIRWAVDNGATVVNLSLSETGLGTLLGQEPSFAEAIRYAWSRGVISVVAAGNDYVRSSTFADAPAVVVSATTPSDTKPRYSNGVGDAKWGMAAPGGIGNGDAGTEADQILSTYWVQGRDSSYAYNSGTSMAAPHVAGAAAVLLALGLTPQAAVDRMLATADDIGSPGSDPTFGAGRLNLAAAVDGLVAQPPPAPPSPTTTAAAPTTARPTTTARAPSTTKAATATTTTTEAIRSTTTTTSRHDVAAPGTRPPRRVARPAGAAQPSSGVPTPLTAVAVLLLAAVTAGVARQGRHLRRSH